MFLTISSCLRPYITISTRHFTPDNWNVTRLIRKEDTMNGFFLYSLLLDKTEQGGILVLPHDEASQSDRLQPALAERNSAMEGTTHMHAIFAFMSSKTRTAS
ncbi:hypothetical protein MSAN_00226500 [Mycena sanguinolenta]|uniref:Uncharacterized protein n=1 Tax=Mycena sanguinolenta TaxID=230812 RepID=A0A8H7DNV7_9AGAR|nr:hypothetical protein MSAN_00226500 [Mycena sanguinolenta]